MATKTKTMKGIDVFCGSPASTAICKSTITKPLHRLNSYLGEHYKTLTTNLSSYSPSSRAPCIAELPLTPRRKSSADVYDLRNHHRRRSNYTSYSSRYLLGECDSPFLDSLPSDSEYHSKASSLALLPATPVIRSEQREFRRSRSQTGQSRVGSLMEARVAQKESYKDKSKTTMSLALDNPGDQRVIKSKHGRVNNDSPTPALKSSPSAPSRSDQVVALRVSLHCKACEAKLRKHLSKMEGVSSFSIDMQTKKVTIVGKVSPADILTSISKVKNAQFWPSPSSGSSTSSSSSSSSSKSDFNYVGAELIVN